MIVAINRSDNILPEAGTESPENQKAVLPQTNQITYTLRGEQGREKVRSGYG